MPPEHSDAVVLILESFLLRSRAFAVLQDAIKCSYDNWRIWENIVLVGADCGELAEVIKGAHRILDLKDKWLDEQVTSHYNL